MREHSIIWLSNPAVGRRFVYAAEFQYAILHAIDPIKYQAMRMDAEISRRTEALNQRDRTDLCITPLESGLFDQKSRDGARNDLQYG